MNNTFENLKYLGYLLRRKHSNILFGHVSNNFLKFIINDDEYEVAFKNDKYEVFNLKYKNNIPYYISDSIYDVLNYI